MTQGPHTKKSDDEKKENLTILKATSSTLSPQLDVVADTNINKNAQTVTTPIAGQRSVVPAQNVTNVNMNNMNNMNAAPMQQLTQKVAAATLLPRGQNINPINTPSQIVADTPNPTTTQQAHNQTFATGRKFKFKFNIQSCKDNNAYSGRIYAPTQVQSACDRGEYVFISYDNFAVDPARKASNNAFTVIDHPTYLQFADGRVQATLQDLDTKSEYKIDFEYNCDVLSAGEELDDGVVIRHQQEDIMFRLRVRKEPKKLAYPSSYVFIKPRPVYHYKLISVRFDFVDKAISPTLSPQFDVAADNNISNHAQHSVAKQQNTNPPTQIGTNTSADPQLVQPSPTIQAQTALAVTPPTAIQAMAHPSKQDANSSNMNSPQIDLCPQQQTITMQHQYSTVSPNLRKIFVVDQSDEEMDPDHITMEYNTKQSSESKSNSNPYCSVWESQKSRLSSSNSPSSSELPRNMNPAPIQQLKQQIAADTSANDKCEQPVISEKESRKIQREIENGDLWTMGHYCQIFKYQICDFMKDRFGHYLIETLFSHCDDNQRWILVANLSNHITEIACHKQGSFTLQTFMHYFTDQHFDYIIAALKGNMLPIMTNDNGAHVISRLFEHDYPNTKFIYEAIIDNILDICTCFAGRNLIKDAVNNGTFREISAIVEAIAEHFHEIVVGLDGNHIIQDLLKSPLTDITDKIKGKMHKKFVGYSKGRYSSFVVDKCLSHSIKEFKQGIGSKDWAFEIIDELLANPEELIIHDIGNLPLQHAIDFIFQNPSLIQHLLEISATFFWNLREWVLSEETSNVFECPSAVSKWIKTINDLEFVYQRHCDYRIARRIYPRGYRSGNNQAKKPTK